MSPILSDRQLAILRNRAGESVPVPPAPRARPRNEESQIQKSLIKWWDVVCREYGLTPSHLFAIPNGGKRDVITASRLKAEGARAGVADLFLMVPVGKASGLFIELKAPGGRPSKEQKAFLELAFEQGYATALCDSLKAAEAAIKLYLKK